MTTRCLQKLDDLDRIAEYVFKKHARQRSRSSVESRLESLRSKLQQYDDDAFGAFHSISPSRSSKAYSPMSKSRSESSATRNSSSGNTRHVKLRSQSTQKKGKICSARTTTPEKCATPVKQKPRCQSVPNYHQTKSKRKAVVEEGKDHVQKTLTERPVSIYGSHSQGHEKDQAGWFNLKPGKSYGVIDAFACDEKNEKPLCYKIDPKTGSCQPRLLKHRSPVRIGQNGILRDLESMEDIVEEIGEEREKRTEEEHNGNEARRVEKKRTVPLSMEEQLYWDNAQALTSRREKSHHGETENLCQQQPVLFNSPSSQNKSDTITHPILKRTHAPKYRFCQESYSIKSQDGMGGHRDMVSVTIQDFSDLIAMDTGAQEPIADKKLITDANSITDTKREEQNRGIPKPGIKVLNADGEPKEYVMFLEQSLDDVKVSFSEPNAQEKESMTKTVSFPKKEKARPKSSDSKMQLTETEKMKSRPSTAPLSSPQSSYTVDTDMYKYISSYFPDGFDLSRETDMEKMKRDSEDLTTTDLALLYAQEQEEESYSLTATDQGQEQLSEVGEAFEITQNDEFLKAENLVSQDEEEVADSVSDVNDTQKHYNSEESLHEAAPMEALSSLRRKIKEDLEKQTKELEQDIQELYLKQKSTTALSEMF